MSVSVSDAVSTCLFVSLCLCSEKGAAYAVPTEFAERCHVDHPIGRGGGGVGFIAEDSAECWGDCRALASRWERRNGPERGGEIGHADLCFLTASARVFSQIAKIASSQAELP